MLSRLLFIAFIVLTVSLTVSAQKKSNAMTVPGSTDASGNEDDQTFSPGDKMIEFRQKMRIKQEMEDFRELVERGETTARLSEELLKSFAQNDRLASNDAEKLNNLEKTLKKIRKFLGGSDDDEASEQKPVSLADALEKMSKISAELKDELKDSTRMTISATSIENANDLLELVAYVRSNMR